MKRVLLILLLSIGLFANENVDNTLEHNKSKDIKQDFTKATIFQIRMESNYYDHLAQQMYRGNKYFTKPVRGKILDRNGKVLAINDISGFSIKLKPHLSQHTKEKIESTKKYINRLFPDLNQTKIDKAMLYTKYNFGGRLLKIVKQFPDINQTKLFKNYLTDELEKNLDIVIKEFPYLSKEKLTLNYLRKESIYNNHFISIVDSISYKDMIGAYPKLSLNKHLRIESKTKRIYPEGALTTHIVGYASRSSRKAKKKDREKNAIETNSYGKAIGVVDIVGVNGKGGLEKQYNNILQGELGYRVVKLSETNKEVAEIERKKPIDGKDLILNIDLGLQKRVNELFKGQSGVAVVMNVNGDVLSAVSYPSYDPNLFVEGISSKDWKELTSDFNHPFTNKIVSGLCSPGSTIKMGMALAFSKAGIDVNSSENCKGYITVGKHKFRCWSHDGHGQVELRRAIAESCHVYFYNKALKIGIDKISKHIREMGLGVKTGVDLANEKSGLIPNKAWKMKRFKLPWYRGETVISSIGQGYNLVTPIQVARYTAFLAIQHLPTPHIVHDIAGEIVKPKYKELEVNQQVLNTIRMGMYDICNSPDGIARKDMSELPIVVAGKTGDSQIIYIPKSEKKRMNKSQLDHYSRFHRWFTTYAPFKNPKYVVTVLVEHGERNSSQLIASEIYKWMVKEGYFGNELKDYKKNSHSKDSKNYYNLGFKYEKGKGIKQDLTKAKEFYSKACDSGDSWGCYSLGSIYYRGKGIKQDFTKAKEFYSKACDAEDAFGCYKLGFMYEKGKGIKQDWTKAKELYRKACDAKNAWGCFNLGVMYDEGKGVKQDFNKAKDLYGKACNGGNAKGCFKLGLMYEVGKGMKQDYTQMKELYATACNGDNIEGCAKYCETGDDWGCSKLGLMYYKNKNFTKLKELNSKACDSGDAKMCFNLGYMYYDGIGVKQDYKKAVELYQKSADQGLANAQYNLGRMYYYGQGVKKDYKKARELFQKSADQGNTNAQYNFKFLSAKIIPILPPITKIGETYNKKTYKQNFYIDKPSFVRSVAISPDGKYIVSGSDDYSVKIWEMKSGKLLKILNGHTNWINSVLISNDGKYIFSGSGDGSVNIWEMESGKLLKTLKGENPIGSVGISKDAKYIVTGLENGTLNIWERESGDLVKTLVGDKKAVTSIALSNDDKYIVSGSRDRSIKVWERDSGKLVKTLKGHRYDINSVAISNDSKYIVSGSDDRRIKIWEIESGKVIKTLKVYADVNSIVISNDDKYIISGSRDGNIDIWEMESGKLLKTLEGHTALIKSVAISKDGKYIVSSSYDDSMKIWDRESGKVLKTLEGHINFIRSIAISNDSKYIVSGLSEKRIDIWDIESGKPLKILEGHKKWVNSVAISSDAKYIVSGSEDGSIKIWERESGELVKILAGHTQSVTSIALSKDDKYIVSSSGDRSVKIWERESGKLLKSLWHWGMVYSVAISSDDKYVVSGSWNKKIRIWDRESGKRLKTLKGHTSVVSSLAISNDTKYIISSSWDGNVTIWDRESGTALKTLKGVESVAISDDSKYIVSSSKDNNIDIWERESGKRLKSLKGHTDIVSSVAISKNSKYIISGSWDGSIKIWNTKSGKLVKEFISGKSGCWQSIDFEASPPVLYRGDDGTFLLKKRELYRDGNRSSYALEPAYSN